MLLFFLFLGVVSMTTVVCRAVGGAATETQVDESQVESGSSRHAKKMDAGMKPSDNNWKIKLLYDGGCPICMIEVQR